MPPLVTSPNTVKPPFCTSRLALLLPMLMNHWLVALLTLPGSFAIAIVPRTLESRGSLATADLSAILPSGRLPGNVYPPPCTTKPLTERCITTLV